MSASQHSVLSLNWKKVAGIVAAGALFSTYLVIKFGQTGGAWPEDDVLDIAFQSTGKQIIAGRFQDSRIERRNTDGTQDPSFGSSWTAGGFNATVETIVVQDDDKIIAGGDFSTFDTFLVGRIARLNSNGSLDSDFANSTGIGFDGNVHDITLDSVGKILVVGDFSRFNGTSVPGIARLTPAGALDTTFGSGEGFSQPPWVARLSSDKSYFLVGGDFIAYKSSRSPYLLRMGLEGNLLPMSR